MKTYHKAIIVIIAIAALLFIFVPVNTKQRISLNASCLSFVWQNMTACSIYMSEHDERLPVCTRWMDETLSYRKTEATLVCPQIKKRTEGEYGYAMNVSTSTKKLSAVKEVEQVPVLFDSALLARNACSGFYGFPNPKERATMVAYLDGHAHMLAKKEP